MQIASYLLFLSIIALLLAIYLLAETSGSDQDDLKAKKRRLRNLFSVQFGLLILVVVGVILLLVKINQAPTPQPSTGVTTLSNLLKAPGGLAWFLGLIVYFALVGVYPLTYLAYRQVVSPSQKKRLAEDFMLLGLHTEENAEREANEQYEMAYSPKQYIWYILLIVLVSGLILLGYSIPGNSIIGSIDHNKLALVFYAYLGAYVFSIQELIRRFNTEDLRPQVYSSILMRMLVAIAVVFVGAQILDAAGAAISTKGADGLSAGPTAWAAILAFLIGIFPKSGIEWFQKLARTTLSTPEEVNVLPVRNIQGISTWHEARLVEMGIDDVQNLATVDIRRILLNTRFDIQEVINWIDQAILYAKVRDKYPRFKEATITTLHEFRLRLKQAQNDKKDLATLLGLSGPEVLDYLADPSPYSNYAYINQYYLNAAELAQTRAQAGRDELVELLIGTGEEQRREFAALRDKYQTRVDQKPDDAEAWANLGLVQFKMGLIPAAHASLKKAVELNSNLAEALANLSQVCVLSGEWEDARSYATRSIDLNPNNKYPYRHRGLALKELKEIDRAIQDFDQAIRLDDHYGEAYYFRGIAYNLLGPFEKAVADLDLAYWLLSDRSDPKFWLEWGTAYLGLANKKEKSARGNGKADYQIAIEKLTEAISRKESSEAYWKRGLAYFSIDYLDPAIRDYLQAIEIAKRQNSPELLNITFLLGETYIKASRIQEACEIFKKIVDSAPPGSDLAVKAARNLTNLPCSEMIPPVSTPPIGAETGGLPTETARTPATTPTHPEEALMIAAIPASEDQFDKLMVKNLKELGIEVTWTERLEIYAKAVLGETEVELPDHKLQELAASTGITTEQILRASLMSVPGVDAAFSALLLTAGVSSVRELSQKEPQTLLDSIQQASGDQNLAGGLPTLEQVRTWITAAKDLVAQQVDPGSEPAQAE